MNNVDIEHEDGVITVDINAISPDILREAFTRGFSDMYSDRYAEAKADLANSVLQTFCIPPKLTRVA